MPATKNEKAFDRVENRKEQIRAILHVVSILSSEVAVQIVFVTASLYFFPRTQHCFLLPSSDTLYKVCLLVMNIHTVVSDSKGMITQNQHLTDGSFKTKLCMESPKILHACLLTVLLPLVLRDQLILADSWPLISVNIAWAAMQPGT